MKGVLFTMALVIFGLTLLSTALMLSQSISSGKNRITAMVVLDRMADNKAYVEQGVHDIINMSGINITASGNTATITEDLPYTRGTTFNSRLDVWKNFVQNNSEFNLTLDTQMMKKTFAIYLNDAIYTHPEDMGGNKIDIINAANVLSYHIALFIHEDLDISEMTWTAYSGTNEFGIEIYTNTDFDSSTKLLDFTKGNMLTIDLEQGGQKHYINIQVGKGSDPGYLRIDNEDRLNMTVATSVTMNGTKVRVMLPGAVLNITDFAHNTGLLTTLM